MVTNVAGDVKFVHPMRVFSLFTFPRIFLVQLIASLMGYITMMMQSRYIRQPFFISLLLIALSLVTVSARAEWYVAGQAGYSFADSLRNVKGTGGLDGLEAPDFDMKNSLAYGGKVGVYPFHGSLGFELDVNHSTPHVKNLDDVPGIHLAVTNVGANILLRYPGVTFQPYLGLGPGILIAHLNRSATTERDTQVAVGFNFLTGIRAFVTPKVALFTEYKYTDAKFGFDGAFGSVGGFDSTYRAHQLFAGVSYHF
jgi:opacity protein-like surface antigen